MPSDITSNLDLFTILGSIKQCAASLSEPHLHQQYIHSDHGPILHSLIISALRDLSQCINIINKRSPVSRLTQDALSLIFHEVHQVDLAEPDMQGTWSPPSISTPLCLSQVSKSWKNVVKNLPTLWTTVKITTPWSLESVKTCLSMSMLLPINLYIRGLAWKCDTPFLEIKPNILEGDIEGLSATLLPHICRCRSISIVTDKTFWHLLQVIGEQFFNVGAPLLETLSIIGTSPHDEGFLGSNALFNQGSPLLTVARLSVEVLSSCYPSFRSITVLSLKGSNDFEFGSMVDVFSECAALETLIIYGNLVPNWVSPPTGLQLPKLRSVQLYQSLYPDTAFLQELSTPSLSEVSIIPYHHLDWMRFHTRMGHLPFHTSKVLTISPEQPSDTPETVRLALEDASSCFPHIESLTLVGKGTCRMLRALTQVKSGKAWPYLQNLTLPEFLENDDENALCDFVSLREASHLPLPRILLDGKSFQRMTRLDWLRTHVDVEENDMIPNDAGGFIFPEIKDSDY